MADSSHCEHSARGFKKLCGMCTQHTKSTSRFSAFPLAVWGRVILCWGWQGAALCVVGCWTASLASYPPDGQKHPYPSVTTTNEPRKIKSPPTPLRTTTLYRVTEISHHRLGRNFVFTRFIRQLKGKVESQLYPHALSPGLVTDPQISFALFSLPSLASPTLLSPLFHP